MWVHVQEFSRGCTPGLDHRRRHNNSTEHCARARLLQLIRTASEAPLWPDDEDSLPPSYKAPTERFMVAPSWMISQ